MSELEPPDQPGPPPLALALLLTVVVFGAFIAVGSPVQLLNLAVGVWLSEIVVFIGVPWSVLRILGRNPARETAADSTTARALVLGGLIGLANYVAWAVPLMGVMQHVLPARLLEIFDGSTIFLHQSGLELIALVAGLGIAAPVCEEFFFRGVLQRGLMKRLEPSVAIVLTALIFSAFHLDPVGFFARFELGIVFGLLAWRSGSIWPGIAAHAANNLVATALFYASAGEAEADLDWKVLVALLLGGNVVLAVLVSAARGRLVSPRVGTDEPAEPLPVARALLPWAGATLLAVAGVIALDWRGVQLRLYEETHRLPVKIARDPQLEALRRRARSGEVSLEEYFEARQLAAPRGSDE